jgi:acetyl-CoA synthetase/medium-chain acyl-CoA synthetase
MGPTAPGHRIGIVDEEGRELPRGEEGDLGILVKPERPVGMFQEYWKNPEATAKCHRGDWYITGDRASMDEEGYLWFVGRADDVINSASYRIGPFEVESALVEHAAVAEAAVIGKADTLRGEIVKAFVVLAPATPRLTPRRELGTTSDRQRPHKYRTRSGSSPTCPRPSA